MFYAQFVLAKKGPLAPIWLAAHLEGKLKRKMVMDTDISEAVKEIIQPRIKISLRTSGFLLLGIARVFLHKVRLIQVEAYIARDRLRSAIMIKDVEKRAARLRAPGNDNDDAPGDEDVLEHPCVLDEEIPNIADFNEPPGPVFNVRARLSDITLNEELDKMMSRNDAIDEILDDEANMNFDDEYNRTLEMFLASRAQSEELERGRASNGEAMEVDHPELSPIPQENRENARLGDSHLANSIDQISNLGLPVHDYEKEVNDLGFEVEMEDAAQLDNLFAMDDQTLNYMNDSIVDNRNTPNSDTQLSLVLGELPLSQTEQNERVPRRPNRRHPPHLVIDDETELSDKTVKDWIATHSDLCRPIEIGPPTKKLMQLKQIATLDRLFNAPSTDISQNPALLEFFNDQLVPRLRLDRGSMIADDSQTSAEEIRASLGMPDEIQLDEEEQAAFGEVEPVLDQTLIENADRINESVNADYVPLPPIPEIDTSLALSAAGGIPDMASTPKRSLAINEDNDENTDPESPQAKKRRLDALQGLDKNESQVAVSQSFQRARQEQQSLEGELQALSITLKEKLVEKWDHDRTLRVEPKEKFVDILPSNPTRKDAARNFYALLELKKNFPALKLSQSKPYGTIMMEPE